MLKLIFELIMIALVVVLIDIITYSYIRKLDRKQRKKLQEQDEQYIKELIESMKQKENNNV